MKIRAFTYLSYLIYWVFFPVLWPVKKVKQFLFEIRKVNKIILADELFSKTGKNAFVIQNGMRFIASQRYNLRQLNTKKSKKLKGTGGFVDYRNAIVYNALESYKMKQFLIDNNWMHYSTGCSCQGKPMYYKNSTYPGYIIVIRGSYGIIRFGGVEKFKSNDLNQFKAKYEEIFKAD